MSVVGQQITSNAMAEDDSDGYRGTLPLVLDLFRLFNDERIRYCHWKSNRGLPAALRGETDLDLLVDAQDAQRFRELMGRAGCKPALSDPTRQYPGLEDWLGLDTTAGRLIHLHVHYRLVLGEQLVKNYTLPLERAFLDTTIVQHGVKVPVPELELIVLSLRALLKCRNRDLLRDLLGYGRSGIPPAILREVNFLRSQTSDERIATALKQQASFIPPDLVVDFLSAIDTNPRAWSKLLGLRRRVRKALAPFQRFHRLRARVIYYQRVIARKSPLYRAFHPFHPALPKRKIPATGGVTVAIVGVDGAGKSTAVREVAKCFSWRLVTRTIYMGNSKGIVSRLAAKLAGRASGRARELLLAARYLADARNRHRNFRAGRRAAAGGAVVIFDRFPLESIQIEGHSMDGARISDRLTGHTSNAVLRWMGEREQRLYREISLPDLLVVLQISPEVASARKPDHSKEMITKKCQAVSAIRREGLPLLEIDASRPLADVLGEIKLAVWRLL
jgi:thymidylate kinase